MAMLREKSGAKEVVSRFGSGARLVLGCALLLVALNARADGENQSLSLDRLTDNAAVQSVTDVFGFVKKKTAKVLGINEDVPLRIAVMPATGEGEPQEQADISYAIHNNLGASQFELIKPHETERKVSLLEHKQGQRWVDVAPQLVAKELGVDGVLYIHVDSIDRIYAAAYAHYGLTITATLYSAKKSDPVWTHTDSIIEREGGISLNPLGILATAVTSATVLSEATRIQLVDQLARKFAEAIPEPAQQRKVIPPRIKMALSNGAEGPFRAGDELKVFMEADAELDAEFFINDRPAGRLEEQANGNYVGRYIVSTDDQLTDAVLEVKALRPRDGASAYWRLSGRISFDTEAPAGLQRLDAQVVDQGVRILWREIQDRGSELVYQVERTNRDSGAYEELSRISIAEFLDTSVVPGETYFYRVTPLDKAGNKGEFATARVTVVAPGPTELSADINADRFLPAIGSPYRIPATLRVNRGSTLTFEAGSIIEIAMGGGLHVLGRLDAMGTEAAPITFKGANAKLLFDNTGTTENHLQSVQLRLADSEVVLENSVLVVARGLINGVDLISGPQSLLQLGATTITGAGTAVTSRGGAVRIADSVFSNNRVAVDLENEGRRVEFLLNGAVFSRNELHLRTREPIRVNGAQFPDDDYDSALARVVGPVDINWESLPPAQNLKLDWLKGRWKSLLSMLKRQQWEPAQELLQEVMVVDNSDASRILADALAAIQQKPPEYGDLSADFYRRLEVSRKAGKQPFLWVQRVQIPSSQKLMSTEAMMLPKAHQRFSKDYLLDNFAERKREAAYQRGSGLPLDGSILAEKLLYRLDRGLVSDFWVLYAIDSTVLNHYLSIAGLIQRQRADVVVAVAAEGDESLSLKRELFRLLESQNIPFVDLSGLPKVERFAQARKQKADLLLTARTLGQVGESSLNANLHVVDVEVSLQVEAVVDGTLVANLHHGSKSTTFRKRSGFERAITSSLNEVEGDLVRQLAGYRKPVNLLPAQVEPLRALTVMPAAAVK